MRMEGFKQIKPSDDMERVIEKDDSNSSVMTDDEGKAYPAACRDHLSLTLNSIKFQILVVCLVVFNGLLIVGELLISLNVLELHSNSILPRVLHYIALGVLSLFVVEVALKVFSLRLGFFCDRAEFSDGIIVAITFALSMPFSSNASFHSSIGLLILLRLWRIVKILNGIVLSIKVESERRLRHECHIREALEQELSKFREYCSNQEKEIESLQAVLRKHDISFHPTERPTAVELISVVAEVNNVADDQKHILQQQRLLEFQRESSR